MTALYDYQLAVGNNNAAGLVNIQTITPAGDRAFWPPDAFSSYDPGTFRIRGDGTVTLAGFASTTWVFGVLTRAQLTYLSDTYCSGGWSGLVTVRTRIGRTTYANYNAVLTLTKPRDSQRRFTKFLDYRVEFTRMVAL